jgi:hypothetical protein
LYTTLIKCESHGLQGKNKIRKRERGAQAIVTTVPRHCQEDRERLMEGPSTIGTWKPGGLGSRGLPSHPSIG